MDEESKNLYRGGLIVVAVMIGLVIGQIKSVTDPVASNYSLILFGVSGFFGYLICGWFALLLTVFLVKLSGLPIPDINFENMLLYAPLWPPVFVFVLLAFVPYLLVRLLFW